MALTRAQYLAPGGTSPALAGQVQGVKQGTGITIASDGTISFNSGTATGALKLSPPNAYNDYQWPLTAGLAGQVLTTDGLGNLSWASGGGSGTVTSVNVSGSSTGLTFTGGPITTSGTITLGGVLSVANGGTGATTQQGSAAALLPPQTGQGNKVLTTDGSAVSWQYALQVPEIILAAGNTGNAQTINIDIPTGFFATSTLTGNCVFDFTTSLTGAVFFTLFLTNDGTAGRTIVWPSSVKWPNGGVTPTRTTTANSTDVYTFLTLDQGVNWYGNLAITNYV